MIAKTSVEDWQRIWDDAKVGEKVRLLDQAFGKPTDAEPDEEPEGSIFEGLTREQRAAMRAILEGSPLPDAPPEPSE